MADDKSEAIDLCGDKSILKTILKEGDGESPKTGHEVTCHYTGTLLDGTKFDSSRDRNDPFKFTIGQGVIQGWSEGVATMKKGERSMFEIVAAKAYGESGSPPTIPGGATLKFDIELLDFQEPPPEDVSKAKDKGILKKVTKEGEGWKTPGEFSKVTVDVKYSLEDGKAISEQNDLTFKTCQEEVVRGLDEGVQSMKEGESAHLTLSPAYTAGLDGDVPATATVFADVSLKSFENEKNSWDYDNDEERIAGMKTSREAGNVWFKAGKLELAIKRYEGAIKLVSDKEKASKEINNELLLCYINAAACYLKKGQLTDAIAKCDDALKIDPKNVKGLYRRATANLEKGDWDVAKQDFKACLAVDANNKGAANGLRRVQAKIAEHAKKEKAMFGGMFDKMAKLN
eukprot:m.11436 g.11436  ORF g.11436 m.11436 type:complete len:400 (+) comp4440_c0_seq1:38-1237(+)